MNDDGSMARLPDLEKFAAVHGLKVGTIADLIAFRSHNESLMERNGERELVTPYGSFRCLTYRDRGRGLHLALCHGRWQASDEVLVRVHEPFTALDLLDVSAGGHSWPLARALQALQRSPRGVAVLLNCTSDSATLSAQCLPGSEERTHHAQSPMDLRTYGIGAQILRDVGVARMRLLGSPRRMPSMTGFGLEVTGFVTHSD
jgi:3,4-dihydroxy 2-butanone 4-phosphate synthase/GTP cyclohydrolase II